MDSTATAQLAPLARSLRVERAKTGLSQAELAEKSGLSANTIVRIETGIASPTLRTLTRLANALGIAPQRLLDAA